MKKFLITISPICAILFVVMWLSWGLKGALGFFGIAIFMIALIFGLAKWVDFVDKHFND